MVAHYVVALIPLALVLIGLYVVYPTSGPMILIVGALCLAAFLTDAGFLRVGGAERIALSQRAGPGKPSAV